MLLDCTGQVLEVQAQVDMRANFLLADLDVNDAYIADMIKTRREKMLQSLGRALPMGIEGSRAPRKSAPVAQIVSLANEASSSSLESRNPYRTPGIHCRGRGNQ